MKKLKKVLTDPTMSIDRWYDCDSDFAVTLFKKLFDKGKSNECFDLLKELNVESQIRFFEAITEVEEHNLLPKYFEILNSTEDINIAESIIDGLRCWDLKEQDKKQLKTHQLKFKGKSKLLDVIINHINTKTD